MISGDQGYRKWPGFFRGAAECLVGVYARTAWKMSERERANAHYREAGAWAKTRGVPSNDGEYKQ